MARSGDLDGSLLYSYQFSEYLYVGVEDAVQIQDKRLNVGILADFSGSMSKDKLQISTDLAVILAEGFVQFETFFYVYNKAGTIKLREILHPLMKVAPREALASIGSIPESGEGDQADAASIAYIYEQMNRFGLPDTSNLIFVVSDLGYCPSNPGKNALEEVKEEVQKIHTDGRTHVIFIGIDRTEPLGGLDYQIPCPKVGSGYDYIVKKIQSMFETFVTKGYLELTQTGQRLL
jgi:hypothetical protein